MPAGQFWLGSVYGSEGWGFESLRARTRDSLRANGSGPDSSRLPKITSQQASQTAVGTALGCPIDAAGTLFLPSTMTRIRGGGSLRERRPGVWEVRVSLGADPVSGRSRVRSLTVHGDREVAEAARDRWAADAALVRLAGHARPGIALAHLLEVWLTADHRWRPSTLAGYQSAAGFLARDRIGCRRAIDVSPTVLGAACTAWRTAGWSDPTVWARVRVLRSRPALPLPPARRTPPVSRASHPRHRPRAAPDPPGRPAMPATAPGPVPGPAPPPACAAPRATSHRHPRRAARLSTARATTCTSRTSPSAATPAGPPTPEGPPPPPRPGPGRDDQRGRPAHQRPSAVGGWQVSHEKHGHLSHLSCSVAPSMVTDHPRCSAP